MHAHVHAHAHAGAATPRAARSATPRATTHAARHAACVRAGRAGGAPAGVSRGGQCTRRTRVRAAARKGRAEDAPPEPAPGLGLKALWYAAEAFGDAVGLTKQRAAPAEPTASAPAVLDAAARMASLRADYDVDYFISGQGEMAAYAEDCVFADPFVSFEGTARFKKNVSNLGGLMRDVRLEITGWEESADASQLQTSWRFACTLALPWRPRLFAAGGTTHTFDAATGRVVRHYERWDIEPAVVVKQLFTPGRGSSSSGSSSSS